MHSFGNCFSKKPRKILTTMSSFIWNSLIGRNKERIVKVPRPDLGIHPIIIFPYEFPDEALIGETVIAVISDDDVVEDLDHQES